jgi:hypothetical protein
MPMTLRIVLAPGDSRSAAAWALRDATGQPLWSSGQPAQRRFWTTKKILGAVVAANVALLATELRH